MHSCYSGSSGVYFLLLSAGLRLSCASLLFLGLSCGSSSASRRLSAFVFLSLGDYKYGNSRLEPSCRLFIFIALHYSPSGCGSLSIALRLFSLSLSPLCLGAPALFFWLHLFRCVYLAVLLSPASPSPSLLSAAVRFSFRCCSCQSPFLVTYLPSPLVRSAVPFATFFLLLFSFTCAFL